MLALFAKDFCACLFCFFYISCMPWLNLCIYVRPGRAIGNAQRTVFACVAEAATFGFGKRVLSFAKAKFPKCKNLALTPPPSPLQNIAANWLSICFLNNHIKTLLATALSS